MEHFLASMRTRALGIPFWVWLVAILAVSFAVSAVREPGRVVGVGGDACGALFGGRNC